MTSLPSAQPPWTLTIPLFPTKPHSYQGTLDSLRCAQPASHVKAIPLAVRLSPCLLCSSAPGKRIPFQRKYLVSYSSCQSLWPGLLVILIILEYFFCSGSSLIVDIFQLNWWQGEDAQGVVCGEASLPVKRHIVRSWEGTRLYMTNLGASCFGQEKNRILPPPVL